MYNKLFDVLYSSEISEDIKVLIAENYPPQLNEGITEDSCYVEFFKTMIDSNISEASLEEVIDEVFGGFSEEEIEAVTEEFIHSLVNQYLNEGLFDTRPIGLTGLRKENEARAKKEAAATAKMQPIGMATLKRQQDAQAKVGSEPKAKGPSFGDKVKKVGSVALGKLKSAVGKVREWTKKMAGEDKPVGLSKLKADQAARINNAVNMGTYKKSEEPKAEEVKATPEPSKEPVKSERVKKAEEKAKGTHVPSGEPIQMDNSGIKKRKSAEEKAKGTHVPSGDIIQMDNSGIKKRKSAEERAKGTKLPAGEEPIELGVKKYKFSDFKTPKKTNRRKTKKDAEQLSLDLNKEPVPVAPKKRGRPRKNKANEAWDEVLNLLKSTNISEVALKEISEMKSSAVLARKAVEREQDNFNKAMKPLETAVANKLPISDKNIANAGDKAARFDKIKTLAVKKYGLKF